MKLRKKVINTNKGLQVIKMIYLTKQDKENIKNMHPDCNVYAVYDDEEITDDVKKMMSKFKKDCEKDE